MQAGPGQIEAAGRRQNGCLDLTRPDLRPWLGHSLVGEPYPRDCRDASTKPGPSR
jgi:hypothetical protein